MFSSLDRTGIPRVLQEKATGNMSKILQNQVLSVHNICGSFILLQQRLDYPDHNHTDF